jgi:L-lactate dehydrogenase complex protein LldG
VLQNKKRWFTIAFFIFDLLRIAMQIFKTSKTREQILSKIKNGLNAASLPMPFPEVEKESLTQVFNVTDATAEEIFADAFIKLGGKFVFCDSEQDLLDNIHILYDNRGWKELLCSDPGLFPLFQNNKLSFVLPGDNSIESADACITGCEALVSRTGSVLLSSRQNYGRVASVFYPVHIIVAYTNQVVPDIQQGIELMKTRYGKELPSMINLNTGPSRTADIEKTLVVGVHGPKEVFCFFINA